MARPRKQIDPEQVLKLAIVGCPPSEIAAALDCAEKLIERRFGPVVKKGHEQGKRLIRSVLFQQAAKGNTAAAIFLCKAWLGMKEHADAVINVSATAVGGQVIFSEETKKQLEDFHVALQRRVYGRVHSKEQASSGNGNATTALN
jgi:hypothetical protein